MKLKIEITMDNAAFIAEPGPEAARVLREYADRIEISQRFTLVPFALYDRNGKQVGKARVTR